MELLWLGVILAILLWFLTQKQTENLRIRGLQGVGALRGEPMGTPECGMQFGISPWNVGTSCPKRNRRMILE